MDLKGYYYAGKDIDLCNIAFILRIVSILLNVFGEFATIPDSLALPYGIVQTVVPVVSVCMVFYSVAEALREEGADDIAGQGMCAMWIYIGCQVATVVVEVITSAMLLSGIWSYALLILLINLALAIVGLVFQLRFYKKSAEQFGVY